MGTMAMKSRPGKPLSGQARAKRRPVRRLAIIR